MRNYLILKFEVALRSGRAPRTGEKRVGFPLSLPADLRKDASDQAAALGGTFTALVEELAIRDLAKGGALAILEGE